MSCSVEAFVSLGGAEGSDTVVGDCSVIGFISGVRAGGVSKSQGSIVAFVSFGVLGARVAVVFLFFLLLFPIGVEMQEDLRFAE